jgi:1,4-dihydroxy-2-naphthoyl-CoA synthase
VYTHILTSHADGVLTLTLNRPRIKNPFSSKTVRGCDHVDGLCDCVGVCERERVCVCVCAVRSLW